MLKIFNIIRGALKGKKAYLVGVLTIMLGLLTSDNAVILNGLAIITLRAGISK